MARLGALAALLLAPARPASGHWDGPPEDHPILAIHRAITRDGVCKKGCECGHEHPTQKGASHPFMQCDVNIQGVSLVVLAPRDWEILEGNEKPYPGGVFQQDLPAWFDMKVLPPWGNGPDHQTYPPLSLYPIEDGTVVLDIGASYGIFSLLIAKLYPNVKVIAVEPIGWLAQLIEENAKRNGIPPGQITVLNQPVTKDGRDVFFFESHWHLYVSNIYQEQHDLGHGRHDHPTTAFKDVLKTHVGKKKVSFAKVDCLGCEQEIMQDIADLDAPFWMQCAGWEENSNYTSREWQVWPSFEGIISHEAAMRCLEVQALGEERLLQRAAKNKRPVEQAILGLQLLADGDSEGAMSILSAIDISDEKLQSVQKPIRKQYAAMMHALGQVSMFLQACALEAGEGVKQDVKKALDLFGKVIDLSKDNGLDADVRALHKELPMLPDVRSGSMFHVAEILRRQGNDVGAKSMYQKAASEGHALARARLQASAKQHFVGTNGRIKGHATRQLITRVRMDALGISPSMHQVLLGNTVSVEFDKCMASNQEASLSRFASVLGGHGVDFDHMDASRFRSWWHSAMECWMAPSGNDGVRDEL